MPKRMKWNALLSGKRTYKQGKKNSGSNLGDRSEFEADFDRVVFSQAFRRLAKKTQVHPLAPNDHIHNRLIHSIEVGSVGRSLGKRLQKFLQEQEGLDVSNGAYADLPEIVKVGCLVHDIGNPPFGHAGEYAIREWLAEHVDLVFIDEFPVSQELKSDLLLFEGNAQGFRLASRTDVKSGYMRLTFASLGAMIKYPWMSSHQFAKDKGKYNIFSSEKFIFEEMTHEMKLNTVDGIVARHPLSFLTEAADDICYRVLDMEDAVLMRIFPEEPIKKLFCEIAEIPTTTSISIEEARGAAVGKLINMAWKVFEGDYSNIMQGNRIKDLKSEFTEPYVAAFNDIKSRYKEVFSHRQKLGYEIGAYKVLGRIIKALVLSAQLLCRKNKFDDLPFISQRCLVLAWGESFVKNNEAQNYSWWLSQIFDYVSGLTDNYAIQVSSEIEGIIQ